MVSSDNTQLPLTSANAVFKLINILKLKNEYEKIRKNSQRCGKTGFEVRELEFHGIKTVVGLLQGNRSVDFQVINNTRSHYPFPNV